jgi:hypothetical protein
MSIRAVGVAHGAAQLDQNSKIKKANAEEILNLADLKDVTITTPATNDVITKGATGYENIKVVDLLDAIFPLANVGESIVKTEESWETAPNGDSFDLGDLGDVTITTPETNDLIIHSGEGYVNINFSDLLDALFPEATVGSMITKGAEGWGVIELENLVSMIADFEAMEYNIFYYLEEGVTNTNPDTFVAADLPVILENATKDGETFGGWFKDAGLTIPVDTVEDGEDNFVAAIISIGDKRLYASFSIGD